MSNVAQPTKKPWYMKWWVWLIAAVVVIGVVSAIVNPRTPTPEAAPAPSATAAPEQTTPPVETVAPEEAQPTDIDRAARLESALKDALGGQEFADIFASDPTLWAGWVTGVRVEGSNAYITLQVGSGDAERDDLGQRAAKAIPSLLPAEALDGISWIIVEDASGVVIDQVMV